MRYRGMDWSEAKCVSEDTEKYFETSSNKAALNAPILRKICNDCSILNECAEWSLKREGYGFWAGMGPKMREQVRRSRGIVLESIGVDSFLKK